MLAVLLKILSILGMILLILLGILLAGVLLVLFFPISYQVSGEKSVSSLRIQARIRWLFGLIRMRYSYPEPGNIIVKLLCFTLYNSGSAAQKKTPVKNKDNNKNTNKTEPSATGQPVSEAPQDTVQEPDDALQTPPQMSKQPQKIQYTIQKICDKIKKIFADLSFYKELLQDSETQGLLAHAGKRIGRILRSIRPRKLRANLLVGTGSPDTTGYLCGVYGMLLPKLGTQIHFTPDFERAVLEGDINAAGHITISKLLFHAICLLFDRRLRQLLSKIRKHQSKE